jgi:starch-binding outer membrane protein, SusD/RagB family
MKKTIYIAILFGFSILASCTVLDLESPDSVLEDDVFKTIDGFRNARIGMYNNLTSNDYYGGTFPLMIDGTSDNGATGGYSIVVYDEIGAKAITPANALVEKLWTAQYKTIAVANHIITKIDALNVDSKDSLAVAERDNIKGEAYFVRAFCHFDALRTWGEHWDLSSEMGVPLVSEVLGFDKTIARATVQNAYDFINADLVNAARLVNDYGGKSKNYITSDAVKALTARVALYQGDKSNAAKYASELINNSKYALYSAKEYSKIYTTRKSPESIFELGFTTQNRSQYNQLTYVRPEALRPECIFYVSEDLGKFFNTRKDDVRANFVNYKDNDVSIQPDGRTEKYRGEQTRDNPAYLFRLAEMYLIVAETADKTTALNALNTLRENRGMAKISTNISQKDLETEIADERRAELNMEGHRYFDLARTKTVETVIGKEVKPVLPIPLREITASGGLIKQNKGY